MEQNLNFKTMTPLEVTEQYEDSLETRVLFKCLDLRGVTFQRVRLICSDWVDVDLRNSRFVQCDLRSSDFSLSELDGASFLDCALEGVIFPDACNVNIDNCR